MYNMKSTEDLNWFFCTIDIPPKRKTFRETITEHVLFLCISYIHPTPFTNSKRIMFSGKEKLITC